jgi:hypothetical protein
MISQQRNSEKNLKKDLMAKNEQHIINFLLANFVTK